MSSAYICDNRLDRVMTFDDDLDKVKFGELRGCMCSVLHVASKLAGLA
jgi:hypothetical protein